MGGIDEEIPQTNITYKLPRSNFVVLNLLQHNNLITAHHQFIQWAESSYAIPQSNMELSVCCGSENNLVLLHNCHGQFFLTFYWLRPVGRDLVMVFKMSQTFGSDLNQPHTWCELEVFVLATHSWSRVPVQVIVDFQWRPKWAKVWSWSDHQSKTSHECRMIIIGHSTIATTRFFFFFSFLFLF